jgi:arsenate reductase
MAEALARLDHGGALEVVSAGSRPAGGVHPDAVVVLAEIGSNIAGARSKSAAEYRDQSFDAVITVCDAAALDCPSWPGAKRIIHWSIEDPSFEPDPAKRIERFRQTRDDLRGRIAALFAKAASAGRKPKGQQRNIGAKPRKRDAEARRRTGDRRLRNRKSGGSAGRATSLRRTRRRRSP